MNWIETKNDQIIFIPIHFNNFTIISCFYTNSTSKRIIYCFKSIIWAITIIFWWFFGGPLHRPRLTNIHGNLDKEVFEDHLESTLLPSKVSQQGANILIYFISGFWILVKIHKVILNSSYMAKEQIPLFRQFYCIFIPSLFASVWL